MAFLRGGSTIGGKNVATEDMILNVTKEIEDLKLKNKTVWHQGNFNPNDYISINTPRYDDNTDLNNMTTTGFYTLGHATNAPPQITGWFYLEVIKHNDEERFILQKVYDFFNSIAFWRTKTAGQWKSWRPLGGSNSYSQTVAAADWRDPDTDGAYEITITHNLGLPNITSVILTDSNGYSMSTGFHVIDTNKMIVYCSSATAGKIVINATN